MEDSCLLLIALSSTFFGFHLPEIIREKGQRKFKTCWAEHFFPLMLKTYACGEGNKILVFLIHLHLTHRNVLLKNRNRRKELLASLQGLPPPPFTYLVPACWLTAPKVQGWFIALNSCAKNKPETSQNLTLLWPSLKITPVMLQGWWCVIIASLRS